jgi:hypothetical protein
MAWIKRNLFFVIGGLVALGLLGAAGFYNYASWSRNATNQDKLKGLYDSIKNITGDPKTSPGGKDNDKTAQAREQEAQLQAWLQEARGCFQPIEAIPPSSPNNPVTGETFSGALGKTIATLQHEAHDANVGLAPDYPFSFKAESSMVRFDTDGLEALAVQLGEVKTLSEVLFAAGINELDGLQRLRVSADDAGGPQSDYLVATPVDNGVAQITPYVVVFKSFGPEIARLFASLAASPHGFLVKSINVQSVNGVAGLAGGPPPNGQPGAPVAAGGRGLVIALKEQLLQVSMEIDIVKLHPKN